MLSASKLMRVRKMPVFGLFMKQTRNHPALVNLKPPARGKKLGQLYRALPKEEKEALAAKAQHIVVKPKEKKPRVAGPFAKFIKAHYSKVRHLPHKQRLATLAKHYKGHPW